MCYSFWQVSFGSGLLAAVGLDVESGDEVGRRLGGGAQVLVLLLGEAHPEGLVGGALAGDLQRLVQLVEPVLHVHGMRGAGLVALLRAGLLWASLDPVPGEP